MTRGHLFKAEDQFPVTDLSTIVESLLDGTSFKILLDSGDTNSFMSMSYYLKKVFTWRSKV